jgi:hypothetical protein
MTPEERAKPIAAIANECCYRSDGYEEDIAAQIARAIRQAENDVLERAAALLEDDEEYAPAAQWIRLYLKHPAP